MSAPRFGPPIDITAEIHWWHAYGVRLQNIGEEGETWIALGHVEPLRMIAAIRKASREQLGLDDHDTFGGGSDVEGLAGAVSHCRAYFGEALDEDGEDSWAVWHGPNAQDHPAAVDVTMLELW